MKVLILKHGEGTYDDYAEITDVVLSVPNNFTDKTLEKHKIELGKTNILRRAKKKNDISVVDWMSKKYKQVKFLEDTL